jgi:hypothetical protein
VRKITDLQGFVGAGSAAIGLNYIGAVAAGCTIHIDVPVVGEPVPAFVPEAIDHWVPRSLGFAARQLPRWSESTQTFSITVPALQELVMDDDPFEAARRAVTRMLQDGRATEAAAHQARLVITWLADARIRPSRVLSTTDGGVAFYFDSAKKIAGGSAARYGLVECDEDGTLLALTKDRETGALSVWEPEPSAPDVDQAAHQIAAYTGL